MFAKLKRKIREWIGAAPVSVHTTAWALKEGLQLGERVDLISPPDFGSEPYLIKIGDDTTVSSNCAFITHDAATRVIRHLPNGNPTTGLSGPIIVGKNCFIGYRTTILAGVHIGDNTIIGACSLVNRNIPSNVVAAGIPCRVICTLDEYMEKHKHDFMYMNNLPYNKKKEYLLKYFEEELLSHE